MANNVSANQSGAKTLPHHAQVQLAHQVSLLKLVQLVKFKELPLRPTLRQGVQLQSNVLVRGAKLITLLCQLVVLQLARVHRVEQDKFAAQEADIQRIMKTGLNANVNLHGVKLIHLNAHLQRAHHTPPQLVPKVKHSDRQLIPTLRQVAPAQAVLSSVKATGAKVHLPLLTQAALA